MNFSGVQEQVFKAADLDGDGRLNRGEYERFYSSWIQRFVGNIPNLGQPENGDEFYERHYELLNQYDTSTEGIDWYDFVLISHEIKSQDFKESIRRFGVKLEQQDQASAAENGLNQLLDELDIEEEKNQRAKNRKQAKKERARLRKAAKKQGTTVEALQQNQYEEEQKIQQALEEQR